MNETPDPSQATGDARLRRPTEYEGPHSHDDALPSEDGHRVPPPRRPRHED